MIYTFNVNQAASIDSLFTMSVISTATFLQTHEDPATFLIFNERSGNVVITLKTITATYPLRIHHVLMRSSRSLKEK